MIAHSACHSALFLVVAARLDSLSTRIFGLQNLNSIVYVCTFAAVDTGCVVLILRCRCESANYSKLTVLSAPPVHVVSEPLSNVLV